MSVDLPQTIRLSILLLIATAGSRSDADESSFEEIGRFSIPQAHQGVAVDQTAFYAITNREIAKYQKTTAALIKRWKAPADSPIRHLNSGIVKDGRLYCAHSNYPQIPMTSSVEIWNADSLEHVGSHSFGTDYGSLTWVDWHNESWWAVFAHYSRENRAAPGKDNRWTTLVQFDKDWQRQQAWVFPPEVLKRFGTYSNSGGSWGPDGRLYCSGHDEAEVYALKLPDSASTLVLDDILPLNITGQAFVWDRSKPGTLYGINRKQHQVVVFRLRGETQAN